MKNYIRRNPIWSFLIINYSISWVFLYPSYQLILKNDGITPLAFFGIIGAYGPTIAAILVQSIESKQSLLPLFKRLIKIKIPIWTYALVVFLPLAAYSLSYILASVLLSTHLEFHLAQGITGILFWVITALPFGPMGEELGWRGYMLPKLLRKYPPLKSSLIVGLAWGVWHLASFSFPGAAIPSFLSVNVWTIALYFANTIALSTIFTFVYLRSEGSVFIAILLHAIFNAASNITADFFGKSENYTILLTAYASNIILVGLVGLILLRRKK